MILFSELINSLGAVGKFILFWFFGEGLCVVKNQMCIKLLSRQDIYANSLIINNRSTKIPFFDNTSDDTLQHQRKDRLFL